MRRKLLTEENTERLAQYTSYFKEADAEEINRVVSMLLDEHERIRGIENNAEKFYSNTGKYLSITITINKLYEDILEDGIYDMHVLGVKGSKIAVEFYEVDSGEIVKHNDIDTFVIPVPRNKYMPGLYNYGDKVKNVKAFYKPVLRKGKIVNTAQLHSVRVEVK